MKFVPSSALFSFRSTLKSDINDFISIVDLLVKFNSTFNCKIHSSNRNKNLKKKKKKGKVKLHLSYKKINHQQY